MITLDSTVVLAEQYPHFPAVLSLQLVIANMLQTRKSRVIMVLPTTSYEITLSREEALIGGEIEEKIVSDIVSSNWLRHSDIYVTAS